MPTIAEACRIYQASQAVDDTIFGYDMAEKELATQELEETRAEKEDTKTDEAKDQLKTDIKKKPGPNNPEAASEFMIEINKAADKFTEIIHSYEPYKIQDAYSDFVLRYYKLLVQVEDYFIDASMEAVLELVDDTTCKS